jgi:hypothetical protein
MGVKFKRIEEVERPMRLLLFGPSGSGKTYGSLLVAQQLATILRKSHKPHQIAFIDSENSRCGIKLRQPEFNGLECFVASLPPTPSPSDYVEAIKEAEARFSIIVVDSITHEWLWVIAEQAKLTGNKVLNWVKIKQAHHAAFLNAIESCSAHLILTARERSEISGIGANQTEPKLSPQQDHRIMHYVDFVFHLDANHVAHPWNEDSRKLVKGVINAQWAQTLYERFYAFLDPVKKAYIAKIMQYQESALEKGIDWQQMPEETLQEKSLEELEQIGKELKALL